MTKNCIYWFVFLAVTFFLAANFICTTAEENTSENKTLSPTVVQEKKIGANGITPFDYRSILLRKGNSRSGCWRCGNPCSAFACCNDGYPQCCIANNACMCCNF